jgi:hypothetical protein
LPGTCGWHWGTTTCHWLVDLPLGEFADAARALRALGWID